jgi:TolB protein
MSEWGGNWDIHVISPDGTGRTSLTTSPDSDVLPEWSPDGKMIAFLTDRDGVWSIYVMNADGSGERKVIDVGGRYTNNRYGVDRDWADEQISWGP